MANGTVNTYTRVAIWLHWIIAILVIANIGLAELTEDFSREARGPYMDVHKAFGVTVLFLSLFRLAWRFTHTPPPLPAGMPVWQVWAAKISHFLFYVLLIGLPLGGWIWMSTYPAPFTWFGLFEVPMFPVEGNKSLQELTHEGHEIGGKIMLGLVVLHILAVLKHHFVDKHNLLARMFPPAA